MGKLYDVRVRNVAGRAENSIRVNGSPESRIRDVRLEKLAVMLDRWNGLWLLEGCIATGSFVPSNVGFLEGFDPGRISPKLGERMTERG